MDPQELLELREKAHRALERRIGVTMAAFAALLAVATLMSHRLHTEEVLLQTRLADRWAYYQAKNTRSQLYANDAKLAELQGPTGASVAVGWNEKSRQERQQADEVRHSNEELAEETKAMAQRATIFDSAEVTLEIAIVLCSIALLTGTRPFWYVSFLSAAIGVGLGTLGFKP